MSLSSLQITLSGWELDQQWCTHSRVLILLFALVLLAGIVLWTTYADRPQAAAIPDDATTGQSTRPGCTSSARRSGCRRPLRKLGRLATGGSIGKCAPTKQ